MPNIINQYGQVKVGVRTQAGGITPLLLDTYSGASAAYSLRKLRTAYSGYAIRVRRSSDNTSQDIGFDANGNLDTTSLLAFVGAGNGFVSIWYDQSGNGRNLTQVTSVIQPRIINAGVLETLNGKPSIYNGGSIASPWRMSVAFGTTISQPTTIFNVGASAYPGAGGGYIWDGNNSSNRNGLYLSSATQIVAYAGSVLSLNYSSSGSTQRLLFAKYNGASSSVAVNLGTATNGNAGTQSIKGININSSHTGSGGALGTNQQEFILWNADKSSDRTGISNNINSYYSTY